MILNRNIYYYVPNLRFDNENYNTYKLKDFAKRITRKNKNNISKLPLTISAQYGLVDQVSFFNKTVASKNMSGYYLLKKGEFAYNKSYSKDYPWGAIKRLDRYEQGCLSTLYICFKCNSNMIDSNYLVHYFESTKWHKQVSNIAGEGARNHGLLNIGIDDFFATKHMFPPLKSQEKIATFLNLVEQRIEIQSKIINTLISQRKSIFLHHDLKIEKHELLINNLGKVNNGCNLSKEDITRLGKSCILYGELFTTYDHVVNNNVISNTQKTNAKTLYSKKHNLVFPSSTTVDAFSLICPISLNIEGVILGGDLFSIEIYPSFNSDYLSYLINFKYKKELSRYAKGTTIIHLHYEDIKKVKLQVASFEEQDKIAHIMKLITEKIDTEKKLLELFKNQKAYLLNNLFI